MVAPTVFGASLFFVLASGANAVRSPGRAGMVAAAYRARGEGSGKRATPNEEESYAIVSDPPSIIKTVPTVTGTATPTTTTDTAGNKTVQSSIPTPPVPKAIYIYFQKRARVIPLSESFLPPSWSVFTGPLNATSSDIKPCSQVPAATFLAGANATVDRVAWPPSYTFNSTLAGLSGCKYVSESESKGPGYLQCSQGQKRTCEAAPQHDKKLQCHARRRPWYYANKNVDKRVKQSSDIYLPPGERTFVPKVVCSLPNAKPDTKPYPLPTGVTVKGYAAKQTPDV